jgi:hypothetical protein
MALLGGSLALPALGRVAMARAAEGAPITANPGHRPLATDHWPVISRMHRKRQDVCKKVYGHMYTICYTAGRGIERPTNRGTRGGIQR